MEIKRYNYKTSLYPLKIPSESVADGKDTFYDVKSSDSSKKILAIWLALEYQKIVNIKNIYSFPSSIKEVTQLYGIYMS